MSDAGGLLSISDVALRLGEATVLGGVSLTAERGEFIGLVGPNGAGKTTLLRTINGHLTPDRGTVRLDGENVRRLSSRAASRRVATVPQDTHLSFDFTVREIVAMGRNPYIPRFGRATAADRERVERAMARTEIATLADRPVSEVSGGERQRVVLARALAQDTPLLLLDEPTASLDIHHQVRTLELIRRLVDEEGKTAIAAIHDLNLAAHYCDRLALLSGGRVLAEGPPASVLTEEHLAEAFDARAVISRHPVTGSVYVTALPEPRRAPTGARVHVIGGGGSASRLLYVLSAAGFEVTAGVLNGGDSDIETARLLGLEAVTEEPFAPIGERARGELGEYIRAADVTVLADVEVGRGNLPNLEAAREANELVVIEERPFDERNYAGARARGIYDGLRSRATVVATDEALTAVTELAAARPRGATPES